MTQLPPEPTRWEDMPGRDNNNKKFNFSLMRRGVDSWKSIWAASKRAQRAYIKSKENATP